MGNNLLTPSTSHFKSSHVQEGELLKCLLFEITNE